MRGKLPAYIVSHLKSDYNFDLTTFENHSFYVMFSSFSGFRSCPLIYSMQTYSHNDKKMMVPITYYKFKEWALTTPRCTTHKLILAV
jgi:hypothetical protein